MKALFLKSACLGLILLGHFGLLSLAFGADRVILLLFTYRTGLVLSVLVIAAFYIGLSVLLGLAERIKSVRPLVGVVVGAVTVIGFAFLLYGAFLAEQQVQQIIASTVLFLGVSGLLAFAGSRPENPNGKTWKNLERVLVVGLLFSAAALVYMYRHLVFYSDIPLTASLEEVKLNSKSSFLHTSFYGVELTRYYVADYQIPAKAPSYISALDNKNFLLINRHGHIYHLRLKPSAESDSAEEELYVRRLLAAFPINYPELYASETGKKINRRFFRVTDIYTDVEDRRRTLYVGHHFYHAAEDCFTLRITKLSGDVSVLLENRPAPEWKTLYETTPCFKAGKSGWAFRGHQSGGRIVGLDQDNLLFSVGDHEFDTLMFAENFPQDPEVSYGKIWKINRRSGEADLFSLGHRNPQGLYRAADGSVWETEHGPAGGDELNKIKAGRNYGFPHVIYGPQYGRYIWPPGIEQDGHAHYEQPVFVWTPAIAVSNLIRVERDLFPLWKHDLLVSSLKQRTLFRLQMHGDRVVYSEPVELGYKIRDLTETPNGEIFVWSDDRMTLLRLRPESSLPRKDETLAQAGERLFFKCIGCHGVKPDSPQGIGPNLHEVYNRRVAALGGYDYSPALRAKAAQRWSRENLDLFLKDPEAFAPGSKMYMKVPDEDERRALVHYLENN